MDQYALVTGGSRNIGAAVARRLSADGLKVIVADMQEPDHEAFVEFVQIDLTDSTAVAEGIGNAIAGRAVTRLVNNAGIVLPAWLEETSLDSVDKVMAVNVKAAIQCAQLVLPAMRAAHFGRIVNISSRSALGKERRSAYAASKAALIGLTKTWALELARHGVTVNAIGPGPILTSLFHAANPPGTPATQDVIGRIPVGFVGEPEDVAHAVGYFASAEARFVTGQILYVCGGMTIGSV